MIAYRVKCCRCTEVLILSILHVIQVQNHEQGCRDGNIKNQQYAECRQDRDGVGIDVCAFLLTVSPFTADGSGKLNNETSMEVSLYTCPPWFIVNSSGHCMYGSLLGGLVECQLDPHCSPPYYHISLPACYCMTSEVKLNATVTILGGCLYSCDCGVLTWRTLTPCVQKSGLKLCKVSERL